MPTISDDKMVVTVDDIEIGILYAKGMISYCANCECWRISDHHTWDGIIRALNAAA